MEEPAKLGILRRLPVSVSLLALAGAVSGYLLVLSLSGIGVGGRAPAWPLWYGPGIWFGIATSILLIGRWRFGLVMDWFGPILWTAASVGAWYAALRFYMMIGGSGQEVVNEVAGMALAGLVGASLLGVGEVLLLEATTLRRGLMTAVAGAGLGAAMWMILSLQDSFGGQETANVIYAAAFAVWQVGVGLAITYRR